MTQYWGGGGTRHLFILNLYNFKNIGGEHVPLCPPPPPHSAVPDCTDDPCEFHNTAILVLLDKGTLVQLVLAY